MALYQVSSYFPSNLHTSNPQQDVVRERTWQTADAEQRVLDNALVLWQRFVEENRRDVVRTELNDLLVSYDAAVVAPRISLKHLSSLADTFAHAAG